MIRDRLTCALVGIAFLTLLFGVFMKQRSAWLPLPFVAVGFALMFAVAALVNTTGGTIRMKFKGGEA